MTSHIYRVKPLLYIDPAEIYHYISAVVYAHAHKYFISINISSPSARLACSIELVLACNLCSALVPHSVISLVCKVNAQCHAIAKHKLKRL